ncbi:hypothetical protein [Streptomyces sp. NPDC059378]|uniref:hypothetical protein n=1 Tax=Streptomyces sp. NPDC059378 TaxID=3346815 RepID=UPI003690C5D3
MTGLHTPPGSPRLCADRISLSGIPGSIRTRLCRQQLQLPLVCSSFRAARPGLLNPRLHSLERSERDREDRSQGQRPGTRRARVRSGRDRVQAVAAQGRRDGRRRMRHGGRIERGNSNMSRVV